MKQQNIKIGLFGFGCVGQGLFELLKKAPGLRAEISKVCIHNQAKERPDNHPPFTFHPVEILDDPEIKVVVELTDDADFAFEIVSDALKKGKAVVSANKKMIANHLQELIELQEKYHSPFLYEAACCASIPIIRNLEEYYDNDLLESIEGIVNGSTNYILSKIYSENISYQDALKLAQENGFAESDPSLDTGGFDAKFKLVILIAHAFGTILRPEKIFNFGIENLGELELNYAKEKAKKIKLVAHAFRNPDETLSAFVLPEFIDSQHRLFHVDDEFNGLLTKTTFSDTQFFAGKGAGATPTASAVLSDISALSYHYRYEYKKLQSQKPALPDHQVVLKVFLRQQKDKLNQWIHHFDSVGERYFNEEEGYLIGNITLGNLWKICGEAEAGTSVVLVGIPENSRQHSLPAGQLAFA